ncbi:glycosyltransferase family 4 protein [Candidatus Micrarchaeota archaeon]|nr:glycosyltransferase family 4 protein [Candidatus Micrarchaeota archaeon]
MQADDTLFISPFSFNAGSTQRVIHFAENIGAKTILPKKDRYGESPELEELIFPTHEKKLLTYPFYLKNTLAILRKLKPRIVHALKPNLYSYVPALIHAKTSKCKIVLDCDEWDALTLKDAGFPLYQIKLAQKLEKSALKHANAIIVSNELTKNERIPEQYHEKTFYVPNGVDTSEFKPIMQTSKKNARSKTSTKNKFNATYLGTLYKTGQIRPIIEAVKRMGGDDVQFTFIGPGNIEEIKKMLGAHAEKCVFTGFAERKKIPEMLSQADALLAPFPNLPSLRYASNMKVFEYMAMQKPIIASEVGELPRVLENGKAGYLVEPGNAGQLLEAINAIKQNPEKAESKARRARQLAVEKYDWRVLARKVKKIHEEIIQ